MYQLLFLIISPKLYILLLYFIFMMLLNHILLNQTFFNLLISIIIYKVHIFRENTNLMIYVTYCESAYLFL